MDKRVSASELSWEGLLGMYRNCLPRYCRDGSPEMRRSPGSSSSDHVSDRLHLSWHRTLCQSQTGCPFRPAFQKAGSAA